MDVVTVEGEITTLLAALREGDKSAMDRLFPLVYREFHGRAHQQLARRRPGETLSTTALVHETYLKLAGSAKQSYEDRLHFFAVASRAMRQILVDYARRNAAAKRGGSRAVTLDPEAVAARQQFMHGRGLEQSLAPQRALIHLRRGEVWQAVPAPPARAGRREGPLAAIEN